MIFTVEYLNSVLILHKM